MQVNSLLSGYPDPTGLSKVLGGADATAARKNDKAGDVSAVGQVSTETIRNIVSKYDLSNITPKQLTEMLQSLHSAGALTDQQLQDLSQIRTDLDLQGVDSNEPVNLLQRYSERLKDLQKKMEEASEDPSTTAPQAETVGAVQRWLSWLQKIATVQASPENAGVDALV